MATNVPAVIEQRGLTQRNDFSGSETSFTSETAMAAVSARERALVEAQFLMAERHPRRWQDVRVQMLDHCSRPRFAEVSRYEKPVGKKNINGEWVEQYARGFSIRFAETLAQEMGNVKPESSITFEDSLMRIVRIGVTDLQKNVPWSREVAFAKTVERKGRKRKGSKDEWDPPDGREVLSVRQNSYGEPTYLVKATEDEMRAKVNAEISKTQRDFLIKLCPRDLLEDWEDAVYATLAKEDKTDPAAVLKRWLDSFHRIGVEPSDLETYFGKPTKGFGQAEVAAMRELGQAIKEGVTTFTEALKSKYDQPPEPSQAREAVVDKKIRDLEKQGDIPEAEKPAQKPTPPSIPVAVSFASWEAWEQSGNPQHASIVIQGGENAGAFVWSDAEATYKHAQVAQEQPKADRPKPVFGKKPDNK